LGGEGAWRPFRELLGTINFPCTYTKLEVRFYLSLLARHAHGWSERHWKALLKVLEYCYTTRKMGIIYSRDLDSHGVNVLYAYADASYNVPRSQGCRITMMNGAAISLSSARHTTTDTSTTGAELTEAFLASTDIVAFRNLMAEVGLFQQQATILYQDCAPAVQVANNRGSLAKRSKAIDVRVFGVRNRIEDQEVTTKLISTVHMAADIGTKALDLKSFVFFRDLLSGYALARAAGKGASAGLPSMVISLAALQSR
jgi:hypothetical protein